MLHVACTTQACCMQHAACTSMLHVACTTQACCMQHVLHKHVACCMYYTSMLHAACTTQACCMLHAACTSMLHVACTTQACCMQHVLHKHVACSMHYTSMLHAACTTHGTAVMAGQNRTHASYMTVCIFSSEGPSWYVYLLTLFIPCQTPRTYTVCIFSYGQP